MGTGVGLTVGARVGSGVGLGDGLAVGSRDGVVDGAIDGFSDGTADKSWKSTPLNAWTQVGGSGQVQVTVGGAEIASDGAADTEGACEGAMEGTVKISSPNRFSCVGDSLGELDGWRLGAALSEGD